MTTEREQRIDDLEDQYTFLTNRLFELQEIMQLNWQKANKDLADCLAERQQNWEDWNARRANHDAERQRRFEELGGTYDIEC